MREQRNQIKTIDLRPALLSNIDRGSEAAKLLSRINAESKDVASNAEHASTLK